ncbi:MAG: hypothetical protein ACRYHQ_12720 [Janthinobacterium lividum]
MPHSKTKSDNDDSHARSAKAQKADEVQEAGSAKAGAGHPVVNEGGPAGSPVHSKGHAMPAASTAVDGGAEDGTSHATAGKAEKEAAFAKAQANQETHGRGHRKAE